MLTMIKLLHKGQILSVIYMQKKREFILKIFAGHEIDIVARNFICATILAEICIGCKVIFEGRTSLFILSDLLENCAL